MPPTAIQKARPSLALENKYDGIVCGIDEVGRGPLAGPVLAACVYVPEPVRRRKFLRDINDSKLLTIKKREAIYLQIKEHCHYGIGMVSPGDIDRLNIHHATLLAMKLACENFQQISGIKPQMALVDGKFTPQIDCDRKAIIKGDSVSISIAAASILAKVTRDSLMAQLHEEFPYYGWAQNAGYGTAEHLAGIKTYGITPHHRRSFAPVGAVL